MPRIYVKKTHCVRGHELTPENRTNGIGQCKQCKRVHWKSLLTRQPDYKKKWNAAHLGTNRSQHVARKYGLPKEKYLGMIAEQENLCQICQRPFEEGSLATVPHVDHDHESGKVRGILCKWCNGGLGCFLDDFLLLDRAAAYLRFHKEED